jgi:nucleoside-diphosphate-sugar epimerase
MLTSEDAGHNVTALVRNEASLESITATDGALTIVKGQPQDQADVEKAFAAVAEDAPAAVIVTLNSARTSDNPFAKPKSPPTLMYDAHVNVLAAMDTHGTRKIVTLQAHGVGESFSTLFLPVKLLVRYSNMGIGYKDHEQVEKVVKQSGRTYVLVRPARFVEGHLRISTSMATKVRVLAPLRPPLGRAWRHSCWTR